MAARDLKQPWLACEPFISARRIAELAPFKERMMGHDRSLRDRLTEKRIQGLKVYEYGELIAFLTDLPTARGARLLDVGPGNSTFPAYLATFVNEVVTLDLERRLEPLAAASHDVLAESRVVNTTGNMLAMPFENNSFDMVTCISAIEHLDDPGPQPDGTRLQIPREEFCRKTATALREMMRVLRPGGYLYVTTDAYLPDLQKTCNWSKKRKDGRIWSAYHFVDIRDVFLRTIGECDGMFDERLNAGPEFLRNSSDFSSYRGRYFTTFGILARKR